MRIAYFDAFSGVSGDMTVGACLDLGVPLAVVEHGLAPLGLDSVRLELGRRVRSGIAAAKFTVHVRTRDGREVVEGPPEVAGHRRAPEHAHQAHGHPEAHDRDLDHQHEHEPRSHEPHEHRPRAHGAHAHGHRHYRDIRELLERSDLAPAVRDRALRVFRCLALAEGRIHAMAPDDVVFHEVGAVDAIVDIVGTAICLDYLGVERIFVSPLPLGSGIARSQHGAIPIPPPATLELLRGFPVRAWDGDCELVTPTGAAILAALATPGPPPPLRPIAIGYGSGERDLADRPNLLRIVLAEKAPRASAATGWAPAELLSPATLPEREEMVVLEANIDDMNPELYEAALEALFAAGARDATLSPITMKKGRPATLLQVIADPADVDRLAGIVLRETTTIGVRTYPVQRLVLPRTRRTVATEYGAVAVKVATLPDGSTRVAPEYEDCRRAAREKGVPIAAVYAAAQRAAVAERS